MPRKIRFAYLAVSGWPPLAWVARASSGSDTVEVLHGAHVETHGEWVCAGAWAGPYEEGGFDQTDLTAGSALRLRGGMLVAVPAANSMDRMWKLETAAGWWVGNTLPGLLAAAGGTLVDGFDYAAAMTSIAKGLRGYVRAVPSSLGPVSIHYWDNFRWDGSRWDFCGKADVAPRFGSFGEYFDFLKRTAAQFAANAGSAHRRHEVRMLSGISRGYDSPATAIVAGYAGCKDAVTIKRARSRRYYSDSGEEIARVIGMRCKAYERDLGGISDEDAVWAGMGVGTDINFAIFEYPRPVCLLITGVNGDCVWDYAPHDFDDPLLRKDTGGGRLGEFSLARGIILVSAPFWGIRRWRDIHAISTSAEMKPWSVPGAYNRPIPRRIIESHGVPRGSFAERKLMCSYSPEIPWPFTPGLREDFIRFARSRGYRVPSRFRIHLHELRNLTAAATARARLNILKEARLPTPSANLFFLWANERLLRRYKAALEGAPYFVAA